MRKDQKESGVTIYNGDGDVVVELHSIRRQGAKLVIDGKALGTMSMDMILTPEEILKGLKMMFCWAVISFIALLPYLTVRRLIKG